MFSVRGTWQSDKGLLSPSLSQRGKQGAPSHRADQQDRLEPGTAARARCLRSRAWRLEGELRDTSGGQAKRTTGCCTRHRAAFCIFGDEDSSCIHLGCIHPSLLVPVWQTHPILRTYRGPSSLSDRNCCPHEPKLLVPRARCAMDNAGRSASAYVSKRNLKTTSKVRTLNKR